jgi:hypothetical protein
MLQTVIGLLAVLHGGIHLLYFGHSQRYFELVEGFRWPEDSWLLSPLTGVKTLLTTAGVLLLVSGLLLGASGAAYLFRQSWGEFALTAGALWSSLTYLTLWDGKGRQLPDQGLIGVLINLVLLAYAFLN